VRGIAFMVHEALRSRGGPPASAHDVYATVVRVLLAHEAGHAVQAKLGLGRFGPRPEQEADLCAGWIAESLGWSPWGDALVLAAVGGASLGGSHPSGCARVAAYREGRAMRRARGRRLLQRARHRGYDTTR
jgi:hypothetical protein